MLNGESFISRGIQTYQGVVHGMRDGVPIVNDGHTSEKVRREFEAGNPLAGFITYIRDCRDLVDRHAQEDGIQLSSLTRGKEITYTAALGFAQVLYTLKTKEHYGRRTLKRFLAIQSLIGVAETTILTSDNYVPYNERSQWEKDNWYQKNGYEISVARDKRIREATIKGNTGMPANTC